jgi:hypothetical protein
MDDIQEREIVETKLPKKMQDKLRKFMRVGYHPEGMKVHDGPE